MKKIMIEVEVDEKTLEEWIEFVTKYLDIFMQGCCGYWLYGVKHNETGWLKRNGMSWYERADSSELDCVLQLDVEHDKKRLKQLLTEEKPPKGSP